MPRGTALAEARGVLLDYAGLDVPETDLAVLLEERPDLLGELEAGLARDTDVREQLQDIAARALMGRGWPTYGDLRDAGDGAEDRFLEGLRAAAKDRGWLPAGEGEAPHA